MRCAKAHKIVDRQHAVAAGRPRRGLTIPKDTVDLWRCMATSDPLIVRGEFERHLAHPRSGTAIVEGLDRLVRLIGDSQTAAVVVATVDGTTEAEVLRVFEAWRAVFSAS